MQLLFKLIITAVVLVISGCYATQSRIIDQCPDVVGSLDHNSGIILPHRTFILVGYTVPCSGTVVAWEFCHHHFSNAVSVTFYPGIWKPINISNNTIFELIQSNNVTYNPRNAQPGPYPCHIFSVSDANQFVAPAGSVVGLYSNTGAQLLRTNTSNIITAHQFLGNQSNVSMNAGNDNNYNIAIKVHLNIRCDDLTAPANGEIISCSSGTIGVGYEGDTCSFTCNTGYELIGSEIRVCLSDGNWNGSDGLCIKGRQTCINNPDAYQRGHSIIREGTQVIVPAARFDCSGRITNIAVSMRFSSRNDLPLFQVWRPALSNSTVYNKIAEVELPLGDRIRGENSFSFTNLSLNSSRQIKFNSRDVIGYYQSANSHRIRTIQTSGYISYIDEVSSPSTLIDANDTDYIYTKNQPLIEVMFDVKCDDLFLPKNGDIVSCSSGKVGVGYEGDTCSFTCNTGYELTGSDNRTCQSDGSWSGTDGVCRRVQCSSFTDPNNGTINCSLGDDGVPSYEDTCSFTCNTGYELTGSDTRTCQSDGSWSGTDVTCERVSSVSCTPLDKPNNGNINCSLGDDGVPSYKDTCSFTCNTGYMLTGSDTRTCQSDGIWSGTDTECKRVGQACINNPNINIPGDRFISERLHFVMPDLSFSCNGRITSVAASMYLLRPFGGSFNLPVFQVWRPLSPGSSNYSKIGQVQFEAGLPWARVHISNVSLTGKDQIGFQSGDIISCYQPINSLYRVGTADDNYTSYVSRTNSLTTTSINLRNVGYFETTRRPLISVMIDIHCDNLSAPANGEMLLCSSGIVGVGYEGDTCSFTCNTGYELTGSDTRTCQSDGSWSGTDDVCKRVSCSSLSDPNNGRINCSLGDNGIPFYEDTCSFTCNTGYELTGSDTRTCQSDGSWSGTDDVCKRVSCSSLSDPNNGTINCSLGADGVPSYEDTCSFTCNTGYELTGSDTRICQSDGSWNGTDNACGRVLCLSLSDPNNGTINCSLGADGVPSYEDTCNFTCNTGYELTSNDTRTCQSNGSWSGSVVMCTGIPTSNSTGSSSDDRTIIGASMGGIVLVLVITTVLLCIVILCVKRSYKEKASSDSLPYNASKHKDIPIEQNPYNVIEMANGTIKPGDSDIPITTNPSYDVPAKPYYKANEDEFNYVQPDESNKYCNLKDTINMDANPSYGVTTGDRMTTSGSMTHQSSHIVTTNECDYVNVHDDYVNVHNDHISHHSTASTSCDVKEESHYY